MIKRLLACVSAGLHLFLMIFSAMFLQSCGSGVSPTAVQCAGDTLRMHHSTLLQMVDCDSFTVVEVKNPWRGGLLNRYLLVAADEPLPCNMPQGTLLRTPLKRTLLFSSVHASLVEELGCFESIKGVCDAEYIISARVKAAVCAGAVADCGRSHDVDVERVASLSPDAVFVLPFENGGYGKLEKLKYPIVECAEYMETSPLAAAEWVRFYGRLFGKAAEADSLFATVCERCENLSTLVEGCDSRPTLMCELKSHTAWYVPAGQSTMGRMYSAAGVDYLFADKAGSGSRPLSFETVLARASDADFWLLKYNSPCKKSRASLLEEFSGYAHFRPFKEGNIYACNTGEKALFEETAFRPDLLLAELIAIFHPSLMGGYKLKYYEKMQ